MLQDIEVLFKIRRFDPDVDTMSRFESFPVQVKGMMTVLDGLLQVFEEQDSTLSFRFACREGVCGSCAMFINGSYRLACQTQIRELKTPEISVNPLPHLKVIKDLVVDLDPFFNKIEQVMPYLETLTAPPETEQVQTQAERKLINEVIDCILCGSCYSACPVVWFNKEYLGPAALTKAYRFVADSRDGLSPERLNQVSHEDGIWRCHTVFNCVEACPKNIQPADAIEKLRKKTISRRLKFWK
ncbi:MAG: succinate dehydrogenase iron-sulfur subunit [Dehalococcoidia bacterium]|nr:succinate dehydrogenase iron-sulfur subunit [Dehalococcoidia bacterium]